MQSLIKNNFEFAPVKSFGYLDRLTVFGVVSGCFAVYVIGATRTIYVGDSGELVAAAYSLGIPHPPGYPLFVLLGKLWLAVVPFGTVAFQMSLFSAFFAALCCGLLFVVCRGLDISRMASIMATTALAFSPSFWSQANVQRVYALNGFFLVLSLWFYLKWCDDNCFKNLALAFFAVALGSCNHPFMGVFAIILILHSVCLRPRTFMNIGQFAMLAVAGIMGLLPWLYLPLRSKMQPRLDWGNPESLDAFWDMVIRRDFWGRAWIEGPADLLPISTDYLTGIGAEFLWVGAIIACVGLWAMKSQHRWLFALIMIANFATIAWHGSRSDIFIWHRYFIPSFIVVAIALGAGVHWIVAHRWRYAGWLLLLLPTASLCLHLRDMDRSKYQIADDFSRQILEQLPAGATLIANDDNILFVLIYLQLVEGLRPDINLVMQGVGDADLAPLHFDPTIDPVFFTHHPNWNLPDLRIIPLGLVFRAWPVDAPPPKPLGFSQSLVGSDDPEIPKDYLTQNLVGHFHYMWGITSENYHWIEAERHFRLAIKHAPSNDVLFYNLGLIYARNGFLKRARVMFARSHAINPRRIPSNAEAKASNMLTQVDELIAIRDQILSSLVVEANSQGRKSRLWAIASAAHRAGYVDIGRALSLQAMELERLPPHSHNNYL